MMMTMMMTNSDVCVCVCVCNFLQDSCHYYKECFVRKFANIVLWVSVGIGKVSSR